MAESWPCSRATEWQQIYSKQLILFAVRRLTVVIQHISYAVAAFLFSERQNNFVDCYKFNLRDSKLFYDAYCLADFFVL